MLGPLGLNKGDWFSFAKHRAPSSVCTDDNRLCMNNWKSGFVLIDWRAIPIPIVWRHPSTAIDDLRSAAGTYRMADTSRTCDPVLRGADGNGIYDFLCIPEWIEDLAVVTPSVRVIAKAKASQKRKASTSGAASGHVAKCTMPALAQSSGSITHPRLFSKSEDNDDDDDACVEIPLVTLIRFVADTPSLGNQGRSYIAPTAKGPSTQDSQGKGIMVDECWVILCINTLYVNIVSFGVDASMDFKEKHDKCLMLLVKDLVLPSQDDVVD
nr:hypothetical protein [Tanacetum cinerariifolium]